MAERREQLLAAYAEAEGGTDDEALDESVVDSAGDPADDKSVVEDTDPAGDEKAESKGAEAASEVSGKSVAKAGKKSADGRDVDSAGKSGTKAASDKVGVVKKSPAKDDASAKTLEQTEKEAAEAAGEAPKSWKVATREHWVKLPKEVREQVQQREAEITQFIGRHGAAIQHKQQFDEVVQPFMPFIAAQQSTPMRAFHGLMTTAARLTTGAPQQKAVVIAEIMDNYGIDAKTLDEVLFARLNGRQPVGSPPVHDGQPPAWAKPLFSFVTEAQQAKQSREQRIQQEAARELEAMEKKPFFSDLRQDIGFLMDRAGAKGELMTMEQAYQKARKMNPEVDKILTQREKAAAASNGATALEKARKAASSIKGAPSTGATGSATGKPNGKAGDTPIDRRTALSQAFDSLSED